MSYNITRFKVRRIDLSLPLAFDFQQWLETQPPSVGKKWCMEDEVAVNLAKGTWTLPLSDQELSGAIEGDRLIVNSVSCSSEGSGYIYSDILLPLFKEFRGYLIAAVVWEGGDKVCHLSIEDGVVEEEEIA